MNISASTVPDSQAVQIRRERADELKVDLFVARQAILNDRFKTYGYELLFRSGYTDRFDGTEGTAATVRVITNTFLSLGAQSILGGRRGFINFPRQMLIDGSWELLPKRSVVVEVLETVEPDEEVIRACRRMHEAGYRFALDDFVLRPGYESLVEMADYIKIDLRATGALQCRKVLTQVRGIRAKLVAEKVETREEFATARAMGFHLFQGFFFTHPVVVTGRDVPGTKLNYLRILHELQHSDLRMNRLEELIRHELSLAHKLLRYVNSAIFGFQMPIETVRQAMLAMGEFQMRRWLLLTVLPGIALDSPNELVATSLVRARFCERVAAIAGAERKSAELFMMGLFSMLDSILNRPLEALVEELNLPSESRDALLGRAPGSLASQIYGLACACESADWESVEALSSAIRIEPQNVASLYAESLNWSDQLVGELNYE